MKHRYIHTVPPLELTFGSTVQLGPKKVVAHLVKQPEEQELHKKLYKLLSAIPVEFEYPQFMGDNHKAHVTKRENIDFMPGSTIVSSAIYLIEVIGNNRVVQNKIALI